MVRPFPMGGQAPAAQGPFTTHLNPKTIRAHVPAKLWKLINATGLLRVELFGAAAE